MNIRVDLTTPITDGTEVVFRSPVDCSQITGLIVYYGEDSKEFALADAHGNNVGDIDHLFAENVVVKVILDVTHAMAYVQNADTNAYIESTFVKSVNGVKPDKTGDVVLPTPLKVTVSQGTEGDYFADTDQDFIQEALDHNRTLVCCWTEYNLLLPLTSFRQGGPYIFTAVTGKQEYSVTIYDTEDIACTVTKLSPKAVLYTPQELTPEQQTQARVNIGADESVLLDFTVEEEVLEIFLPLDEHKEDINNSTEIMLYAQLQMPTADEAAALGTIGADVGYLKNQSTGSFIDCSALLRNDQILPTNSITYIKFVTVTSHIHKSPNAFSAGWGPMGYITKVIYKANQSPTVVTGQVANRFIPTDKNAVLKIAASHPIGMGSRFKLAIRR